MGTDRAGGGDRPAISLAVITRDEERHLPRLLEAASRFAGEVVIVDSGSTDRTLEIARAHGARVIEADWPGFGVQKQRALESCRGEWIVCLDADECPDPVLCAALEQLAASEHTPHAAYAVDRLTEYQGEFVRHAWSPDWIVRVVRRGAGRYTADRVHERLLVDGSVGRLEGRLLHFSFEDLDDHYGRLTRYARLGAEELAARGRRFRARDLALRPPIAFAARYLLKRGFLDGVRGLLVAGATAIGTFMKYAYLFELQRRESTGEEKK